MIKSFRGSSLFQELPQKLFVYFPIRLITHRQIKPCFFIYDAFIVGEGIEAFFSVLRAHSAFAEAAEAHFAGGKVDDGVVDASPAVAAPGSDLVRGSPV